MRAWPFALLTIGVGLTVASAAVVAEPAPWAPLRFGGTGVFGVPLDGELVLTSLELHVIQQAGSAQVDGVGRGHGPIAGIGGTAGLGTFSAGEDDACADEVDAEGNSRWTCGQLTLGPTAIVGWAWGTKLESGFVRQDRMVYLRSTPHLALVKSPERGFAEVGLATAIGFSFRPFQIEATWIKIPGDSYVGAAIGLSASVSGWLVNDRAIPAALAADEAEAEAKAQAPLSRWRIDLRGQALEPVVGGDGEITTGVGDLAVLRLSGFPDSTSRRWHRWSGLGGELHAVGSGRADGDSALQLGPVAMAGTARFKGDHPLFALYGRVSPMIGWRTRGGDDRFDYGGYVAVGATVGVPADIGDDDDDRPSSSDTSPISLGLEATAGWMRGAVYVGAGLGLVLW